MATLSELQTPLVVTHAPAMTRNIARMAQAAAAGGKRLRPHGKTHKSGWTVRQQVGAGAVGLTCATPGEAEVFAEASIEDLRIAYPPFFGGLGGNMSRQLARTPSTSRCCR